MDLRLESAMGYLATRTREELLASIERVNAARARMGLPPMTDDAAARMLAQAKAS